MAKAPKKSAEETPDIPLQPAPPPGGYEVATGIQVSPLMLRGLNAMKMKHKDLNVRIGSNGSEVGIEPYALVIQYIFALDIIPFGVIRIVGDPKTRKTTMIQTLIREGMENRMFNQDRPPEERIYGQGKIVPTEGKWSSSKQDGVMGPFSKLLSVTHAKVFEQWQEIATFQIDFWRNAYDAHRNALRKRKQDRKPAEQAAAELVVPPLFLGIDSFTGAQTKAIQDKVHAEGSGAKTFQDRAMIAKMWLETHAPSMIGYPITLIGTNHQSLPIDSGQSYGEPKKKAVGGLSGDYMCSLTLDTRPGYDKEVGCSAEGMLIKWTTAMSSIGVSERFAMIEHIETYDVNEKPLMYFNFDRALTSLLFRLKTDEKDRKMGARVIAALGGSFTQWTVTGKGKFYGCPLIGVLNQQQAVEEGVDATEFGRRLQTNPEARALLQRALYIQKGIKWTPELAAVKDPTVIESPVEEEDGVK